MRVSSTVGKYTNTYTNKYASKTPSVKQGDFEIAPGLWAWMPVSVSRTHGDVLKAAYAAGMEAEEQGKALPPNPYFEADIEGRKGTLIPFPDDVFATIVKRLAWEIGTRLATEYHQGFYETQEKKGKTVLRRTTKARLKNSKIISKTVTRTVTTVAKVNPTE